MNLKISSLPPQISHPNKISRGLIVAFLVISFIGFLDATYLTVEHYLGVVPPCTILQGCEKVVTSSYSVFAGIPVALFGSIYYLVVFLLVFLSLQRKNDKFFHIASYLTVFGFLASAWFMYVQFFILKAICLYCTFSAITSTLLFIFGIIELKLESRSQELVEEN